MTDPDLVEKKLAFIETCVRELRAQGRPELLEEDIKEARFIERTLQIAVQSALDVASHIVADDRLGEPRTNKDLFDLLRKAGWFPAQLAVTLRQIVGLRNILVHGYQTVDIEIVRDILENHLDDLLAFVEAVRSRLR